MIERAADRWIEAFGASGEASSLRGFFQRALDIAPAFVGHLRDRVEASGLGQVTVAQSEARSITLPAASVDVVFMCDVYHHVEYPLEYEKRRLES